MKKSILLSCLTFACASYGYESTLQRHNFALLTSEATATEIYLPFSSTPEDCIEIRSSFAFPGQLAATVAGDLELNQVTSGSQTKPLALTHSSQNSRSIEFPLYFRLPSAAPYGTLIRVTSKTGSSLRDIFNSVGDNQESEIAGIAQLVRCPAL